MSALYQGIDVSKWQQEIDWKKVQASGIQFTMVRASYGISGVDEYFMENIKNAEAVGVERGAYHYCYAQTPDAARQEAEHFLKTITGYSLTYPVALDLEDAAIGKFGKEKITEIALAFLETVKKGGYYVMLYTSLNWVERKLDMEKLKQYDLWLAQWRQSGTTYTGELGIWQYSDAGNIPGISGTVDLDKAYQNYPVLIREQGWNHLEGKKMKWEDLTLEEGIELIRKNTDLEDGTIQYLLSYRYYDVLVRKLGAAVAKG